MDRLFDGNLLKVQYLDCNEYVVAESALFRVKSVSYEFVVSCVSNFQS